jgi:DNA replication and repair protein RecF
VRIQKLSITNLRNIKKAELHPGKGLNIIQGSNGAGKTTVLESIYLLARARAMKTTQHKNLINHDSNQLNVYSELLSDSNLITRLGIRKDKKTTLVKQNGEIVRKLMDLAKILPIATIAPNIQRIVEEGPVHRRKLLNWGLFHVEHQFGDLITRYNLILKHRNALLGHRSQDLSVWTTQLAESGERISELQTAYLEKWKREIESLCECLPQLKGLELNIHKGWKRDLRLFESLEQNYLTDESRHFTSVGPHRLDIRISFNGYEIRNQFSRGQKKLVSLVLILGQARLFQKISLQSPILLVDDLRAELDKSTYITILKYINSLGYQSFLTSLDQEFNQEIVDMTSMMFHVEQGHVTQGLPV